MGTEKGVNRALPCSKWRDLVEVAETVINEGNVDARVTQGDDVIGNVVAPLSDNFGHHDWR